MPTKTEWVAPARLLRHDGVNVYRTYKYGDVGAIARSYGYTLSERCGEDECECEGGGECRNVFDVRELPNWKAPSHPPFLSGRDNTRRNKAAWEQYHGERREERHIAATIRMALRCGWLVPNRGIVAQVTGVP